MTKFIRSELDEGKTLLDELNKRIANNEFNSEELPKILEYRGQLIKSMVSLTLMVEKLEQGEHNE